VINYIDLALSVGRDVRSGGEAGKTVACPEHITHLHII
jgi:hypothetical protein